MEWRLNSERAAPGRWIRQRDVPLSRSAGHRLMTETLLTGITRLIMSLAFRTRGCLCTSPPPMTIRPPSSLVGEGVVAPASRAGGVGPGRSL